MSYAVAHYAGANYAGIRGAAAPPAPPVVAMPFSEFSVEFTPGVWSDVWPYVVDLSTRRGRNAELGAFETGQGFVTLRNETRIFDPDYAAGPWYGKLRPNRRVKFRATYGGATYPVMVGYIDRISQISGGPNEQSTVIAFSDLFKILNRQELPVSAYMAEVAADRPVALWRLDEPVGSTSVRDSIGDLDLAATGTPTFGVAGMVSRDPGTAVSLAGFEGFNATGPFPITASPLTIEVIYRHTGVGGYIAGMVRTAGAFTSDGAYLGTTAGGGVFEVTYGPGVLTTTSISGNIADGLPHHIVLRWDAGVVAVFIDGVLRNTPPAHVTGPFTTPSGQTFIGGGPIGFGTDAAGGDYQMVAFYNYGLSDARIAVHSANRVTPWNGDLPGPRINRVLDLAGVAAADRDVDAGTTPLQSADLGGSPLGYIQRVGDTELSAIFVTRDGKLRHIARRAGQGENPYYLTSQATFIDSPPAAGQVPYRYVDFEVDDSAVVTRATVSREGSVAVTYQDAAAVTEFGIVEQTADGLLHDSDAYSAHLAEWLVNSQKVPESRIGAVTVTPMVDPATVFPKLLGIEIGDRVTLTKRPKVGAAITADYRVEAVAHAVAPAAPRWASTLQLTPFNQSAGLPVWVWGVTRWGQHVWGT